MDMDFIQRLVHNNEYSEKIQRAETDSERELIVLLLIRNNLNDIRKYLISIQSWVMFFGLLTTIGMIFGFIFLFI